MNTKQIAQMCHEVNKAYCDAMGDTSQVSWDDAAEWQKDSAVKGVVYALSNPDVTPESQHDAWLKDKEKAGWIYGEIKDAEAKIHPCIVPYNDLPQVQKAKDYLFRAVVKTAMKKGDFLTDGQKAVGITFNPSKDPEVDQAKQMCADLIDMIFEKSIKIEKASYLSNTIKGESIRSFMIAQMMIVKYLTFQY